MSSPKLVCSLALAAAGLASADQVILKNGDRVTGSIVKKDGKTLTVKTDQFGVIAMAWDQVESVKTDKPVNVVAAGRTVQGTLSTNEGKLEVATGAAKLTLAPAEVSVIRDDSEEKTYERMLHPGLGELWAGTASLGLAGTSGNAETLTFTTSVNAARATNTDRLSLYFSTIEASALVNGRSASTAQAVRGGLGYNRNLKSRLFVNLFNDYEYDKFQNLNLRFVLGAGLGYHAYKSEKAHLDLVGGGDFNRSSYTTPLNQSSAEAFWGDDYGAKLTGSTSIVQSFRMFNDLTSTGSFRAGFDIGISTKLSKWLNWNVSVSDRYLNHPAPGRKDNDLVYTTGLGITFAK